MFPTDVRVIASLVTYLSGRAVQQAAFAVRDKLIQLAAALLGCSPHAVRLERKRRCWSGPGAHGRVPSVVSTRRPGETVLRAACGRDEETFTVPVEAPISQTGSKATPPSSGDEPRDPPARERSGPPGRPAADLVAARRRRRRAPRRQRPVIVLMWVRHGGLDQLGTTGGALTAAGQLTALLGTYLALIQLVLMGRSPWLDEPFGMDRLAVAHRWLGFATVWLIGAHGVLTTIGYAMGDGAGVVDERAMLLTTYPYVLWATAGFGLFVAGRRQLRPGRPAPALVRDLVRPPPVRLPRHRPRVPAPAVRRRGLHATTSSPACTGSACTSSPRAGADLPRRAADRHICVTGSASANVVGRRTASSPST